MAAGLVCRGGGRMGEGRRNVLLMPATMQRLRRYTRTGCSSPQSKRSQRASELLKILDNVITYGNRVLSWMPASVQNLLVEIQRV